MAPPRRGVSSPTAAALDLDSVQLLRQSERKRAVCRKRESGDAARWIHEAKSVPRGSVERVGVEKRRELSGCSDRRVRL
jgi:hypothetical protein